MRKHKNKPRQVVNPRFAKTAEYYEVIKMIEKKGECPFCPGNFKYHQYPILKRKNGWIITRCSWPYKNTEQHFLIISEKHGETLSFLTSTDLSSVCSLADWVGKEFGIKGGVLTVRFGSTDITGATVCHLHFHLIVPKRGKTVNFPIG
jgi:ATP adenylyltransferase